MTIQNREQELQDTQLDQIVGGLLLPAVQSAREAARRKVKTSSQNKSITFLSS